MTTKQFIEKAIDGGWNQSTSWFDGVVISQRMFLDPKAWQAVGKVEGWDVISWAKDNLKEEQWTEYGVRPQWKHYMHRMIDALCEEKTVEQFLETLE